MDTPTNVLVHVSLLPEIPVRIQFFYPEGSVDVGLTAEQARELSALLEKAAGTR